MQPEQTCLETIKRSWQPIICPYMTTRGAYDTIQCRTKQITRLARIPPCTQLSAVRNHNPMHFVQCMHKVNFPLHKILAKSFTFSKSKLDKWFIFNLPNFQSIMMLIASYHS